MRQHVHQLRKHGTVSDKLPLFRQPGLISTASDRSCSWSICGKRWVLVYLLCCHLMLDSSPKSILESGSQQERPGVHPAVLAGEGSRQSAW